MSHIAFSKDGRLLASSAFGQDSVELWDLKSGRQLRTFELENAQTQFGIGGASEIALSGDGNWLAAASQKEIDVWRVKDGERVYRFPLGNQTGISLSQPLALSASGQYIAWTEAGKLHVRDLANRGQEINVPANPNLEAGTALCLSFSPDGQELAVLAYSISGTTVETLAISTGKSRSYTTSQHGGLMMGHRLGFSRDGHLVIATSASSGKIVRSGSAPTPETKIEVRDLTSNAVFTFEAPGRSVTLSEDATLVAVEDQAEVQIWDVVKQRRVISVSNQNRTFVTGVDSAIDFSGDAQWAAIGDNAGKVHILDAHTGKDQAVLSGHANLTSVVAFDSAQHRLYSGSKTIWDLESGIGLRTVPGTISPRSIVSTNGSLMAEDAGQGAVRIWDLAAGKVIATLKTPPEQILSGMGFGLMSFSPDGSLLALVRQEDLSTPEAQQHQRDEAIRRSRDLSKAVRTDPSQAASWGVVSPYGPDNPASQVKLFDAHSGAERLTLKCQNGYVSALAFSADGKTLACAAGDSVSLWNTGDGKLLASIPLSASSSAPTPGAFPAGSTSITSVAFSPDGRTIGAGLYSFKMNYDYSAMQQQMMKAMQQGAANASRSRRFGGFGGLGLPNIGHKSAPPTSPAAVNPGEMVQVSTDGPVLLLDATAHRASETLSGHQQGAVSVSFSHDGKFLATSGRDSVIRIWECSSGSLTKELTTKTVAYALAFSPDDKLLASGQTDGSTLLWDLQTGRTLATLVSLYDGDDWLVVTPDGLFDGSPAAWNQILWRYSHNTFDVAPVESFFSEYFYPGLLADLISGKRPKPPREISEKDRRQPEVRITSSAEGKKLGDREVLLTVEVVEAASTTTQAQGSGARDLRLFRNGSLVKAWHGDLLNGKDRVTLEAKVRIVAGINRFTAYAFNHDNVKSRDAQFDLEGADTLRRQPVTYVLTVGINKFENPDYYLKLAVADADSMAQAVRREQVHEQARVELISLYDAQASRAGILGAIGKIVSLAQPEDRVVLFFASHGTAAQDRFYLIPYDLGFKGRISELDEAGVKEILTHSVSDRDLEQSLESMDAGKILVIIDACNSGQALEAEEKRRGPMNSRGLAQLAYEKGMYILTASQSYQSALEISQLGHGLLTYTLVSEGLDRGMADESPKDGKILDREWLNYATHRVPEMQLEIVRTLRAQGRSISFGQTARSAGDDGTGQRPKVFYRRELEESPWIIAIPGERGTVTPQ